ncbi:MAG: penicillin-binding protein 1C [Burkholderiales bacterium]
MTLRRHLRWLVVGGLLVASGVVMALPDFAAVRTAHRPSDLTVLDRSGAPLQLLRIDTTARRLPWLPLAEFSPALRTAVILSEDQRFAEHSGIDWSGLARSAAATLGGSGRQGGSTLTMQLAGLIDPQHARPREGRGVTGKLGQLWAARQLEADWRKDQILEAYLNLVPLRGELVGVPVAAKLLFGKHPSGLDAQEAALLAALIRGPNAAPAVVAQRACGLLKAQRQGCDGLEGLAVQALRPQPVPALADEALAPHFARWLRKSLPREVASQPTLPSTVDARLQRLATQALRQQLAELSGRNVEDGAVLVLDNASGEVRAWVGSSGGLLSAAPSVDAVLARRQPGSTLKPFIYGLAFERKLITPASLIDDAPLALNAGASLYLPQNYDRRHHGWVSARTALAASLNVPAVKVGAMLSPDAMFERFNAFGLKLSHSGGWHGYALALGSAEVTLLDLTNAYRTLANGGRWSPVRGSVAGAPVAFKSVADAAATWLVSDILSDNTARALTFGLDNALVTRGWAAVKTGTSKDLRDNWCIGYSPRYTVGVWVGNAGGAPMHQVSGTSGAAPVWRAVMAQLQAEQPASQSAPAPPPGLVWAKAATPRGAADEPFLAGTEPRFITTPSSANTAATLARHFTGIRTPSAGSVHALDPDMPPATQRIIFDGEPGAWWLDGRPLGRGPRIAWAPVPGRHVVELRLADGRVEQRAFEVRGARLR